MNNHTPKFNTPWHATPEEIRPHDLHKPEIKTALALALTQKTVTILEGICHGRIPSDHDTLSMVANGLEAIAYLLKQAGRKNAH